MRRAPFLISLLLAGVSLAGATASSDTWSRAGRTVVVMTAQRGTIITIRYTQTPHDGDGLALLRSCVEQRRAQYAQVTCVAYESSRLLNVVDRSGNRTCWSAAAIGRGTQPIELQPDNPALTLSASCGGKTQLP